MNSRTFVGRTSREVLQKVRHTLGPDALILANRPVEGGIELTAMSPADMAHSAMSSGSHHGQEGSTESIVRNLMHEISAMKALLQRELSGMAWYGLVQRAPARSAMMQLLLNAGFSPQLARELIVVVPERAEAHIAHKAVIAVIKNRLHVMSHDSLVSEGGVYALIGPTGVGKTTTIAKLAARCVVTHGAASVGLVTTDSYRIAAHDQLRVYGKILNVPVHAVKDVADMAAILKKLGGKRTVLIDTVGMSQRDQTLAEQSALLKACGTATKRMLLLNATANTATLDEVVRAYSRDGVHGCVITKLDESASLATALDCAIRYRLPLSYVTNGQSVPEDIHLANLDYLLHRAMQVAKDTSPHMLRDEEIPLALSAKAAYA